MLRSVVVGGDRDSIPVRGYAAVWGVIFHLDVMPARGAVGVQILVRDSFDQDDEERSREREESSEVKQYTRLAVFCSGGRG